MYTMQIIPFLQRRKKIVAAVAVFLALSVVMKGCNKAEEQVEKEETLPTVDVIEITPGLQRSFSATGEVEAEKSANFIAEFKSTVEAIAVNIGDTVSEGDALVTLRAFDIEQRFNTANAFYVTTGQNLAQTRIQAQQNVEEAQIAMKTAQINLEKLQKENSAKRKQAEETLKSAKLTLGLSEASAQATLDAAISKTETTVRNALNAADELLEFSPEQSDLTYEKETHIGVRDPAQKNFTMNAMIDAYNDFKATRSNYQDSIDLLKSTEGALNMLLTTLQNSVTSTEYTIDELNTDITGITTQITNIRSIISELQKAKTALDSTMQKTGGTSQVIIDAEAAYETTIAQLDASQRKAELDVERAKSVLDSAIASARASEISAASNLTTARGELEQARITQDKLQIVAPFEGVVTDIPLRVGREVQQGEVLLTMENDEWLKIITYVSAEEARQMRTGDTVTVDGKYTAHVSSVAPSADPASKKFKVEVRIGQDTLQIGSFVELEFSLKVSEEEGDSRLFLPVTSVHVSAAETFVWIVENDKAYKRTVTIGELTGRYVEITGGIEVGDTVIINGGRALSEEGQSVLLN